MKKITTLFILFLLTIVYSCNRYPKLIKKEIIDESYYFIEEVTVVNADDEEDTDDEGLDVINGEKGNSSFSNLDADIDCQWCLCYFLDKYGDTLFAAYDRDGKRRITPLSEERPVYYALASSSLEGGIFMCKVGCFYEGYNGYEEEDRCVFPDSLKITDFDVYNNETIKLQHEGDDGNRYYSLYGKTWIFPPSQKVKRIRMFKRFSDIFIAKSIDEDGNDILIVNNKYGNSLVPSNLKTIKYKEMEVNNKKDKFIILIHKNERGTRIYSVYNFKGECVIPASNEYNYIVIGEKYIGCAYLYDSWGTIAEANRVCFYTYDLYGWAYIKGKYHWDEYDSISWYNLDGKEKEGEWFDYSLASKSSETGPTVRPPNSLREARMADNTTTNADSEPSLLLKGLYTVVLSGTGPLPPQTFKVYEDRLNDGTSTLKYKSTNNRGERVYAGIDWMNHYTTYYVNPENGNIRMTTTYGYGVGSNTVTHEVIKGDNIYFNGNFQPVGNPSSNYPAGGNTEFLQQERQRTGNPVQPHQRTKDCALCHGSGKCSTCNGTHRIDYQFGLGTLECPNCKPNGACSSCGGSGKKTTTEYY